MSKNQDSQPVGVIGAGSFGTAMANLLALNTDVLIYARKPEVVDNINRERHRHGVDLHPRIRATNHLEQLARECTLLLPIVPSTNFRTMMRSLAPYLHPYHLLIHGTKGFDLTEVAEEEIGQHGVTRANVHTMSEVLGF